MKAARYKSPSTLKDAEGRFSGSRYSAESYRENSIASNLEDGEDGIEGDLFIEHENIDFGTTSGQHLWNLSLLYVAVHSRESYQEME